MKSNPIVSVALMSYNQEKYVRQAMDCVLAQKCSYPMEIVVADDGSIDSTRDIVLEYQKNHPGLVRVLPREANKGVLGNFRDLIKSCTGKYVAICHSDDYWHDPLKLEKQVSFLESNPEYGAVHTDAHYLLTNNSIIEDFNTKYQSGIPEGRVFEALITGKFFINTLTVCFKRSLFEEFVDINDYIKYGIIYEDLPTWLELAAHTKFKYLPESTATYRILQNSITRPKDLDKKFVIFKNHHVIKQYFIEKYKVSPELIEEFEIMYHRKKFNMAYKLCSYPEAVDSYGFLKEKKLANTKLRLKKLFLRYPFMYSTLKKIKKIYTPKTAVSHI